MRKILLMAFILLAGCAAKTAAAINADSEIAKLQSELSTLNTSSDSVKVLYNIFDLGNRKQKIAVAQELYAVAGRAGDVKTQLDILRLVTSYIDAATLNQAKQRAALLPDSKERRETQLFLDMKEVQLESRRLNYAQQSKRLSQLLDEINDDSLSNNPHKRLLNLYKVIAYRRNQQSSEILVQNMDSLLRLVESNHYDLYALRNLVYSEAAMIYTDAHDYQRAIKADQHLMNVISELEKHYQQQGRVYRNFHASRYNVLRRMMRNYKGMTPQQADHIYARMLELAALEPSVAADLNKGYVRAYYDMAKSNYKAAIPEINRSLKDSLAYPVKTQMLQMLVEAARHTGDTAMLVAALNQYTDILEDMDANALSDKVRELQVAYDVSNLKAKNTQLQLQNALHDKEELQQNMTLLIAVWIICLVALVLLLFLWSRYRKKVTVIYNLADSVTLQRDQLKYKRYHEYDAPEKFPTVPNNRKLQMPVTLENMLADALFISALGREEREKHRFSVSLSHVLDDVQKGLKKYYKDSPCLHIESPKEDILFTTDRECMVYMLGRILMTAMDRTNSDIYLSTYVDTHHNTVRFTLVHHGVRIPVGKEEILFTDFIHFNFLNNIEDSALFVSRLNAFLLQCAITYNPYAEGAARLIISVPIKANI